MNDKKTTNSEQSPAEADIKPIDKKALFESLLKRQYPMDQDAHELEGRVGYAQEKRR